MRILHVIYDMAEQNGGPPRVLESLARSQAKRGDDVTVLSAHRSNLPQLLTPGREGKLTVLPPCTEQKLYLPNASVRERLREAVRGQDIVHVHGIWRYHSIAGGAAARKQGVPFIVSPDGSLGIECRQHKMTLKRPYFLLFERPMVNHAAAIHCCSHKEEREMQGLGLKPRMAVVPNPVEFALLDMTPDNDALAKLVPNLKESDQVILCLGRITPIKNIDGLLEAFIRIVGDFPRAHLIIAGPHEALELVNALKNRIAEAKLATRVSMPGMIRDAAKAALLRRTDIFAQPSRHENFGVSVAEAMLFGKPCIVSDGVALADELREANGGIICTTDVSSIEAALRSMLSEDEARQRWGRAAASLAGQFAPDKVAEAMDQEYRRCLAKN